VSDRPAVLGRSLGDGWDPEPASRLAEPAAVRAAAPPDAAAVWAVLDTVPDPEIPVISVVELGIVRDVVVEGARVTVVITPTYSGCPAMQAIEHDVLAALAERGWNDGHVRTVFTPAWTTDWMSEATRAKLRAYGIAPPGSRGVDDDDGPLVFLRRAGAADAVEPPVTCPFCGSSHTALQSRFGATACKALHVCRSCRQPFEEFKPI
jgi:ring-1,2-phenylacetyl-CoA epoxidase subunit PaaD